MGNNTITATITTKGQITIPATIRKQLRLEAGDRINFFIDDNGEVKFSPVNSNITNLKGIIKKPKKPVSLRAMEAAIKARGTST